MFRRSRSNARVEAWSSQAPNFAVYRHHMFVTLLVRLEYNLLERDDSQATDRYLLRTAHLQHVAIYKRHAGSAWKDDTGLLAACSMIGHCAWVNCFKQ